MPADDGEDPGANTAMFRAYVDQPAETEEAAPNRTVIVALVVAIVVLAVAALLLVAS